MDLKDIKYESSDEKPHKGIMDSELQKMHEAEELRKKERERLLHQPFIPQNPIEKTNEKLEGLHTFIESESGRNSESTKKWNRAILAVGVLSLIISALFSVLSYVSSGKSSENIEKLLLEQNMLIKSIKNEK